MKNDVQESGQCDRQSVAQVQTRGREVGVCAPMNGSVRTPGDADLLLRAGTVRSWPFAAYTPPNAAQAAPPAKQHTGRKHIMFGLRAKRRNSHYREAMRQLQPFATETNALWLSGYYRGIQALVPGMSATPSRARSTRDC
jgi:hypothetical protein